MYSERTYRTQRDLCTTPGTNRTLTRSRWQYAISLAVIILDNYTCRPNNQPGLFKTAKGSLATTRSKIWQQHLRWHLSKQFKTVRASLVAIWFAHKFDGSLVGPRLGVRVAAAVSAES